MIVIKRSGLKEDFDFDKIKKAVNLASAGEEVVDLDELDQYFTDLSLSNDDREISVDEIHDDVEKYLLDKGYRKTYKSYILERNKRDVIRSQDSKMIKGIAEKLEALNVQNQNANVDERSFGGRIGEAARFVTKNYALEHSMSKKSKMNHLNNEIYIHDLDNYSIGTPNCLTVPFDDLLSKGFKTRQVDIRPANSVNTAFQLLAVIFQIQSLNQFGGVSASHIDWTMVPYVRKSFYKHFVSRYIMKRAKEDGVDLVSLPDDEVSKYKDKYKKEFNEKYGINIEKFNIGTFEMDCVNFHIDDEKIKAINEDWYDEALLDTRAELKQAVEGMYHNLNSLQSRSGNQLNLWLTL